MISWGRYIFVVSLALLQALWFAQIGFAQTVSGNALYVASEQVLAVPSKNGDLLQVLLSVNIDNNGPASQVDYRLPAGFQNPRVVAGSVRKFSLDAEGRLRFTAKARGVTTVAVEFSTSLNQNGTELTWLENVPVRKLFFVIPEGALTVSSEGGFQTDSQSIISGSQAFRQFTKLDIPAGTSWTASIALLPTANGRQARPLPTLPVLNSYGPRVADLEAVGNLLLVAFILLIGMFSIRRGSGRSVSAKPDVLAGQKVNVMQHWADIEIAYANGEMEESEYHDRRARMKKRALELEKALRDGSKR